MVPFVACGLRLDSGSKFVIHSGIAETDSGIAITYIDAVGLVLWTGYWSATVADDRLVLAETCVKKLAVA